MLNDDDGAVAHKGLSSVALDHEAWCSPSPVERRCKLHGLTRPASCEGYLHGTLTTAGIEGASPTPHSLTKYEQRRLDFCSSLDSEAVQQAPDSSTCGLAVSSCRLNVLGHMEDPGMHPKVLIPATTNRPDLTHSTADILGAQPCPKDVIHRPRDTNPLNPEYRLATGRCRHLPCGPSPRDKLLRDVLAVADIPGATQRPKTPAARAAAARAAAGVPASKEASSRPGILDITDIEGAAAVWRPKHKRHTADTTRNTTLNVSDINCYMARFKPGPRDSTEYKGHPGGPRAPLPIRPRSTPAIMDNSLRKFDIEGTSVRLAPRCTHTTSLNIADIEGAHTAGRDRASEFASRRAASAAAAAQQQVAQALLSALQLDQQVLLALWRECSRLDRDRSGLISAKELTQAMQHAQVQLSACDAQQLAAALRNNAGLLNYKQLTRQLKGHVSRPASALAAGCAAQSADATCEQQRTQPQAAAAQQRRPQSASLASGPHAAAMDYKAAASVRAGASTSPSKHCRPSTAPARPCAARRGTGAASGGAPCTCSSGAIECKACAQRWRCRNRVGVSIVSHWFAGSRRDDGAAGEAGRWKPGPSADALTKGWGLNCPAPWDAAGSSTHGEGVEPGQAATGWGPADAGVAAGECCVCLSGSPDVVPAWMLGAEGPHGSCRVLQPFGPLHGAAAAPAAGLSDAAGDPGDELLPLDSCTLHQGSCSNSAAAGPAAGQLRRPASAGPCCLHAAQPAAQQCRGVRGATSRQQMQQRPVSASAFCHASRPSHCTKEALRQHASSGTLVTGAHGCSLGLAERRRMLQSDQQDLLAVRMLA